MRQFSAIVVGALLCAICATARAERVLHEWRFDSPAALEQWTTNEDLAGARIVDGALRFHCPGRDPILVAKDRFDVAATPWQAIEIRMRADHEGDMELFWSGTSVGKYGGFSEEKASHFTAQGDGQWHTYRVYPFWQSEGRIIQLRVDPYYGATFDIALVRIVDAEMASPSFWRLVSGVNVSPGGRLALTDPAGYVLRREIAEAETAPIVSVPMAGGTARHASIVFATSASPGLHQLSFPIETSAGMRTYNVDMLSSPDWRGRIVALGIRPGENAGDTLAVPAFAIRASDRAQGKPRLRVLRFTVDEALPRAGVPFGVSARVADDGGETARKVAPVLAASGATIVGPARGGARDLLYGQEETWHWTVRSTHPAAVRLALHIACANAAGLSAATAATVTPRVALTSGKVPPPTPVHGKIDVGVYYFPGWKTAAQWSPITRFPERRPILGWYREGDPAVADWDVRWAVEHGITFFAYDWYWNQGARSLEHALHDGLFHAKYGKMLKFCLLWANHNPDKTSSLPDCVAVTRYWIQNYFGRPEYYTVGGRPVVIIFSTYRLRKDLGHEGVRPAFEAMRKACTEAGVPPVYMIACVYNPGEAQLAADEGYDAITAYNWPGMELATGVNRAPFATLLPAYKRRWESFAQITPIPIMTPVSAGWDSRPWGGETALARTGRTPALFKKHLQDARQFIAGHPDKTLPVALIEAWNELGEGSYIEPTQEFGFGYLDAIRDVFTDAPKRHVDLTPADTGVPAPQVEPEVPGRTSWSFARAAQGWASMMNQTDARVVDGALRADTTGDDPAFSSPPLQTGAGLWRVVKVRMRLTALGGAPFDDSAQLFWSTRSAGTSEAASVHVPVNADGVWRDLVLRVRDNPRWRGVITGLRWDPCNRARVRVELQSVALVP